MVNSVFGHKLISSMAVEKGCPHPLVLEDGLVYYHSESILHGKGKWQYTTWDKLWDPSVDPEAIAALQERDILPMDYVIRDRDSD